MDTDFKNVFALKTNLPSLGMENGGIRQETPARGNYVVDVEGYHILLLVFFVVRRFFGKLRL